MHKLNAFAYTLYILIIYIYKQMHSTYICINSQILHLNDRIDPTLKGNGQMIK